MRRAQGYSAVQFKATNQLFHVYRTEQDGVEWQDIKPFCDKAQGAFHFLYTTESYQQ